MVEAKEKEKNDVKICDLIHLVHMPEVNKMFFYKLGEVSGGMLQKAIRKYQARVDKYRKDLYYKVRRKEKKAGKQSYMDLYWFELGKFEENDWGLTAISPWPPLLRPHFTIMPQDIIDRIAAFQVKFGRVVTWEGECSRYLKKIFTIKFVKLSTTHIVGVVRETSDVRENPELADVIEKFAPNRESEQERMLRYYMVKYPELCKDFIKWFIDWILPHIAEWDNSVKGEVEKK
jgi:hypothetical protein